MDLYFRKNNYCVLDMGKTECRFFSQWIFFPVTLDVFVHLDRWHFVLRISRKMFKAKDVYCPSLLFKDFILEAISSDDVNTSWDWPRAHWTAGSSFLGAYCFIRHTLNSCYATSVWEFLWDLLPPGGLSFRIEAQKYISESLLPEHKIEEKITFVIVLLF